MKIGYVRVSTVDQNEARQIEAMKTDGVEKIYMDKKSGKDFDRPEYQKMISELHKGDVLEYCLELEYFYWLCLGY